MATLLVMDASGDTRHSFDPADETELLRVEDRFCEHLKNGYTAASRNGTGPAMIARSFDPTAEETLFIRVSLGDDRLVFLRRDRLRACGLRHGLWWRFL